MKLSHITRPILKGAAILHRTALRCDCDLAHRHADHAFESAARQLELVNAAKKQLEKMQSVALNERSAAFQQALEAQDELDSRIGSV